MELTAVSRILTAQTHVLRAVSELLTTLEAERAELLPEEQFRERYQDHFPDDEAFACAMKGPKGLIANGVVVKIGRQSFFRPSRFEELMRDSIIDFAALAVADREARA